MAYAAQNIFMVNVEKVLRRLRRRQRLSQPALAKQAGVSRASIQNYETRGEKVGDNVFPAVATAFGYEMRKIIDAAARFEDAEKACEWLEKSVITGPQNLDVVTVSRWLRVQPEANQLEILNILAQTAGVPLVAASNLSKAGFPSVRKRLGRRHASPPKDQEPPAQKAG